MRVTQDDFKNKQGEWVQRAYISDKYVWTTSGVLWNNVKERCTINGATQKREPTYIGCTNKFTDFQDFTNWHVKQVGYGLGYQLDADILNKGGKVYSKETCLLIPSALNKFLQTYKGKGNCWPQGVFLHAPNDNLNVRITTREYGDLHLGVFQFSEVSAAREIYRVAKNAAGVAWYEDLVNGVFVVDPRVVEHMRTWEHICDWKAP